MCEDYYRKHGGQEERCVGLYFFDLASHIFSRAQGAHSKHNVDCSRASQEMPQLQIDHRPSKTRVALGLEGDKQPAVPSQCIDPSHNLHYWERKYCQLPTNKHLPISREGIAFFLPGKKNKVFLLRPTEKECYEKIRHCSTLFSFLFTHFLACVCFFFTPFCVFLWPLSAALPLK